MQKSQRTRPAHTLAEQYAFVEDRVANENSVTENRDTENRDIEADRINRQDIDAAEAGALSFCRSLRQPTEAELDAMIADSFPCSDPYY